MDEGLDITDEDEDPGEEKIDDGEDALSNDWISFHSPQTRH
jgi:hypothetical protein